MELIVTSPEEFGAAGAAALQRALAGIERPYLGVPSGSTPIPVYRRLFESGPAFPPGTRAFAVDEYCWPDPTHPGTNASFFRRSWPAGPGIPIVALPRADAENPHAEIEEYCRSLAECGGLDLVLLGIGRNGHIAFNEPGSGRDSTCRVVQLAEQTRNDCAAGWPEGPPGRGMTIGICEIMAARRIILLAAGAAKRQVLHAALSGPVKSEVPASFLQEHPVLTVICDAAAGALLA